MLKFKIQSILDEGEGLRVEFKECKSALSKDVYETVCAFLNRRGGEILLGVKDNGKITGIDANKIDRIKKNFVTAVNNPVKISPTVYLSIEEVEIERKKIFLPFPKTLSLPVFIKKLDWLMNWVPVFGT